MTLEEFKEKAKLFNCKIGFLETSNANNIIEIIIESETIKYIVKFLDSSGSGLIVLTDKNLHSCGQKGVFSFENKSIPIEKITSIERKGVVLETVTISEGTNKHAYKSVANASGLYSAYNSIISEQRKAVITKSDSVDDLRKFKQLLDDGVITQEDFNIKKKQLLGI